MADVFHVVKGTMDTCKKSHPAFVTFARAFADAMLVPVSEDVDAVNARLVSLDWEDEDIEVERRTRWRSRYLRFCRRTSGTSRVKQYRRVLAVIEAFKDVVDPTTNELLIRDSTKDKLDAVMLKIAAGYYVDPVDVDMFKSLGADKNGNPLWQNCRGTNALEGVGGFGCGWLGVWVGVGVCFAIS